MRDHAERDEAIRAAVKARILMGESRRRAARDVGDRYGLTLERVLQICDPEPGRLRQQQVNHRRAQRAAEKKQSTAVPREMWERLNA